MNRIALQMIPETRSRPGRHRQDGIIHYTAVPWLGRPFARAVSRKPYCRTCPSFARRLPVKRVSHGARASLPGFVRMAGENSCEHDMLVQIRWQRRKMAVPLSQLEAIGADESTQEVAAIGITGFRRATASDLRTAAESSETRIFYKPFAEARPPARAFRIYNQER